MTHQQAQHNAVVEFLSHGLWSNAARIERTTGVSPTTMRALCQDHPGSFISGPHGYKRADLATALEIAECVTGLMGRAGAILERASALQRRNTYLHLPAKAAA